MARIQIKRGTAAAWTAANPILSAGEWGTETDTGKTKLGDGFATWTALDYTLSSADLGQANGVASLDSGGKVPAAQLPPSGLPIHNTDDETTNYERLAAAWNANQAEFGVLYGGTGVNRSLRIGVANTAGGALARHLTINPSGNPFFQFSPSGSATAGQVVRITSSGLSSSNNTQVGLGIEPVINQTGTASYTGLLINPTETSTGSGNKRLIDAQVGGVSRMTLSNSGALNVTGSVSVSGIPVLVDNGAAQVADVSVVAFGASTVRAPGTGDFPFGIKLQRNIRFSSVTYRVATPDASGNLVVELRNNGVAVPGSSATIAAASQVTGGTATGFWQFVTGDILTVHVTAVGTTPGNGLIADVLGWTTL